MKLNPLGITRMTTYPSANWFSATFLAAFLTIISASAAVPPPSAEELNAAEKWIVERVTAGKEADLSRQFPEEKDRKLSAHFLEDLLTGARPDVTLHRHGVQIKGASIDEPIDLENAQIPGDVLLNGRFSRNVTFAHANFGGALSFVGSKFQDANFNGIKVEGDVVFDTAEFEGPADFGVADIIGNLRVGINATFRKAAKFDGMKVRGSASFDNAVFEGPVHFQNVDIEGNFEAIEAKFLNRETGARFSGMKVRGDRAVFRGTVFEGPFLFFNADIAHDFLLQSAKLQNKKMFAVFMGMKVGSKAFFDSGTVFEGSVDFQGVVIASDFWTAAKFLNKKGVVFNRMRVGGLTSFSSAFEGPVSLRYADFASLDLSHASWPKAAIPLQMQGMSYKYISAAPLEPESHEKLLALVNQSAYSADVYSRLEEFFLHEGYRADADKAFIAGKRREREQYFHSRDWFGWLGSWMLDLLVGYGRRPWQAGIPCAVLIALGYVLFSPKKMEPQNPEDTPRVYNRFWYSLGLFLPFVDLQSNKVWKPKTDQTFLRNYMRVHILLGWILVPLVLAAVTGLIK